MRKRQYRDLAKDHITTIRSFFIYNNGLLFLQMLKNEFCTAKYGDHIFIDMNAAKIQGRFAEIVGTGFTLFDWTIERK